MFVKKDSHQHTFKKAYKKVHNDNGARYMLFETCTTCPFKLAYDLVADEPKGDICKQNSTAASPTQQES